MRHPYPALSDILGHDQSFAVQTLHRYVRPAGDYILTRGDLDTLDQAFRQIEEHLQSKWDGRSWTSR